MIRLDALTRRPSARRDGGGHIELSAADHEEPTWEVRQPGDQRRKRLDGRTRAILSIAAAAAVVVNAGAAWIYWRVTGSETGHWANGTVVQLALRARSDQNHPLQPGQTGNLTITVTNDDDFPIRITTVAPGVGKAIADTEHRERGCTDPVVRLTRDRFVVSWEVPRNTIGAFTIGGALAMSPSAAPSCTGATFTLPVQASGVGRTLSRG